MILRSEREPVIDMQSDYIANVIIFDKHANGISSIIDRKESPHNLLLSVQITKSARLAVKDLIRHSKTFPTKSIKLKVVVYEWPIDGAKWSVPPLLVCEIFCHSEA